MKTLRSPVSFFLLISLSLGFSPSATAQLVSEGTQHGFAPFGSFSTSSIDAISLVNGNLHVEIPLLRVKERGTTFTYSIVHEPAMWDTYFVPNPNPRGFPRGWTYVEEKSAGGMGLIRPTDYWVSWQNVTRTCVGYGSYVVDTYYVVSEPNGTLHQAANQIAPAGQNCSSSVLVGQTLDGSGIRLDLSNSTRVATLKDGTQVYSSYRDSNGNIASASSDTLGKNPVVEYGTPNVTYTSPTGLTALGPGYITYSVTDSSGTQQVYRFDYAAVDIQTNICHGIPNCYDLAPYARVVPTKLTLPTGKFYQFTWATGSYGQLTRIDLPTGGYIAYPNYSLFASAPPASNFGGSTYRMAVLQRSTGPNSGTWNYTLASAGNLTAKVTDPLGNDEVHTFTYFGSGTTQSSSKYETNVQYYSGSSTSGTLLRTVTKDYAEETNPLTGRLDANVRVIRQTTTLENGQTGKVETDFETTQYPYGASTYTATRLNPLERREYDFGPSAPGPLLRRTDYSYLHTGSSTYLNLNIVDRVTTTSVYDGAGTLKAQSTNEWDNYTQAIQSTNAVQHDSTFNSSYTTRGNMTAAKRWRNTDGLWLTTRFQYDDVGNIVSSTDPGNHTTTTDFSDSWGNTTCAPTTGSARAYPKSVTNALGHVTSFTYFSCTGFIASVADPNLQTATFTYDLMNRPDVTNYPDGGQVNLDYDDTALWIRSKTLRSSGNYVVAYSRYDSLGRLIRQEACEDGSDTCATSVKTDTTYDALSRKLSVSNPYRATTDATYGLTTFEYDALSRPTKTIPPDGTTSTNNITTAYSGNSVTVTDQAGKKRKKVSDALGRLTQVFEPDASGNFIYETDHQYDVLGNLTRTDQKGNDTNSANWRTRTLVYNSLSQVTSELNPETGTISYQYDSEGKLSQKTDARSITTCLGDWNGATCNGSTGYDALHRVLKKTFSDSTPAANFLYDAASVDGLTILYPVGRLVKSWNANSRTVDSFDQMGRIKTERQCTPINCGTAWFQLDYNYDLAGGVTSYTNGMGTTFTQSLNPLEQVTQIASSWVDTQHPQNLASSIAYYPSGDLSSLTYGNTLVETQTVNTRLQPTQIAFGTALTLNYGFVDGNGNNNGNLMSFSASGAQSFSRTYSYDELNRLKTMTGATGTCTGLSWNYDIWANRKDQTAAGGSCLESHQTISSLNRVMDTGYNYDLSGNLAAEPSGRTYQYDADNQMISANTGALGSYVYDADGRRIRKAASGATTEYIYDLSGNVIAEKQGTVWTKGYVYLGGKLVAQYSNSTTYFVHEDSLGSTRLVTRMDRSTEECEDYYPYGELVSCGTTTTVTHKFTGKERDTETGLDDFNVRYFGSSFGHFLSPDPTFGSPGRPQTLNRYTYVLNNPLRFIDPTGLTPQDGGTGTAVSPTGSCDHSTSTTTGAPVCTAPTPPTRQNETSNDKMQKQNDPTQPQTDRGRLDVKLEPNNASRPGEIDIQSGIIINGTLTTSQKMAPGEATITVNLFDNKDTGSRAPAGSFDVRVGQVEQVTVKIGDTSHTTTLVPIQIMASNKDQNFGFQGSGALHFVVADAKGNIFKGDHRAEVSQPHQKGGGHADTFIKDAGRKTFNVPD